MTSTDDPGASPPMPTAVEWIGELEPGLRLTADSATTDAAAHTPEIWAFPAFATTRTTET